MKNILAPLIAVLAIIAAVACAIWGNGQRTIANDTANALASLYNDAIQGTEHPDSIDGLDNEAMVRRATAAIRALRAQLAETQKGLDESKEQNEALSGQLAAAEQRVDVVAASARSRAAAAADAARAETSGQIAAARAETDRAVHERVKAQNDLAALQTRFDDLQSSYEALLAMSGDQVDIPQDVLAPKQGKPDGEGDAPAEGTQPPPRSAKLPPPVAGLTEDDTVEAVLATIPATPETGDSPGDYQVDVDSEVIGNSLYFSLVAYSLPRQELMFQLQSGDRMVYRDVSPEIADSISQAGDNLDQTYDDRIKGQFPCDREEDALWRSYGKWAQDHAATVEVPWTVQGN